MVSTVLTAVVQTVMCLKAVIRQADTVIEAANLDGEETLVIRVGMFFTLNVCNFFSTIIIIFIINELNVLNVGV